MQVHFSPQQEARLSEIAACAGKDTEQFVREAALRLLEEQGHMDLEIDAGFELIAAGECNGSGI